MSDDFTNNEQLKTLSALVTRSLMARAMGQQFGGQRDLYEALGWEREPLPEHFLEQYLRGLGKPIIDRPVNATWKKPPPVRDGEFENSPFLSAWKLLEKALKIWSVFKRADKLSLLGRYGGLFIGVKQNDKDLTSSLAKDSLSGPSDILFLSPYSEKSLEVAEFGRDVTKPTFNLPIFYNLKFNTERNASIGSRRVHRSRIIHIVNELLEDDVYGVPRLLSMLNDLADMDKLSAIAESAWRAGSALHADIRDNYRLEPGDKKAMSEELDEFIHGLRRVIRTSGTNLNLLGSSIPDPTGVWEMKKALISAKSEIPPQILYGTEAHQVAGIGNESWAQYIAARQITGVEQSIVRPTIDRLIGIGALPAPSSGTYQIGTLDDEGEYHWPSVFESTQKQKNEAAKLKADTIKTLTDSGMSLYSALIFVGYSEEKALKFMRYDLVDGLEP